MASKPRKLSKLHPLPRVPVVDTGHFHDGNEIRHAAILLEPTGALQESCLLPGSVNNGGQCFHHAPENEVQRTEHDGFKEIETDTLHNMHNHHSGTSKQKKKHATRHQEQ